MMDNNLRAQLSKFNQATRENLLHWLEAPLKKSEKNELLNALESDPKSLEDPFHANLQFGTGGMRGKMGLGTARMNFYTVTGATQGLATYLNSLKKIDGQGVFISYDSRINAREFAFAAAQVLAGNGIKVYITENLRPTPYVSYACRELACAAAIMITASHNPKEYNGYKVYFSDGCQVLPPHDSGIINCVNDVDPFKDVKIAPETDPLIQLIDDSLDQKYVEAISRSRLLPKECDDHGNLLRICFTPLHGTGAELIEKSLAAWGFRNLSFVESQKEPDGTFPTTPSPNPETREALHLGLEQMISTKSDILLATDPDADRLGVALLTEKGAELLSGNQIATLCVAHILKQLSLKNTLPERPAIVKSIVTTPLLNKLAHTYNVSCFEVLTGFKYIGHLMTTWENAKNGPTYLFGAEESYGFLYGTHARDKDALITAGLISEISLHAKLNKKTLIDLLDEIYEEYGYFIEKQKSISFDSGLEASEKIETLMNQLRRDPPKTLAGEIIVKIDDYESQKRLDVKSKKANTLSLPKSDVISLETESGLKLIIRPSGTEPKIKFYAFGCKKSRIESENIVETILTEAESYIS